MAGLDINGGISRSRATRRAMRNTPVVTLLDILASHQPHQLASLGQRLIDLVAIRRADMPLKSQTTQKAHPPQ